MALDELTLRELETGFHYFWQEFANHGLVGHATLLAEFYQHDETKPDRNLFVAWGLVCRFFREESNSTDAWEEAAAYLLNVPNDR